MAQVTVELRNLLNNTNFRLFDFEYPFDDPKFKAELEQAVIDYYYFYEIGQETPDAFKHRFRARWLRIIGRYNELYNTTLLKYDILSNYSLSEALEQLNTSSSHSDSNSLGSDYPQQPIAGGDYLSEASKTTVDNKLNEERNYQRKIEGLTGSTYPDLIKKHRDNIINIKNMVIQEMKPCFILVH